MLDTSHALKYLDVLKWNVYLTNFSKKQLELNILNRMLLLDLWIMSLWSVIHLSLFKLNNGNTLKEININSLYA